MVMDTEESMAMGDKIGLGLHGRRATVMVVVHLESFQRDTKPS